MRYEVLLTALLLLSLLMRRRLLSIGNTKTKTSMHDTTVNTPPADPLALVLLESFYDYVVSVAAGRHALRSPLPHQL
jgi:hypothetical protein